jgi:hypothetical protein
MLIYLKNPRKVFQLDDEISGLFLRWMAKSADCSVSGLQNPGTAQALAPKTDWSMPLSEL